MALSSNIGTKNVTFISNFLSYEISLYVLKVCFIPNKNQKKKSVEEYTKVLHCMETFFS